MPKVIGIDLGTTNSCVAVMEGGEPVVIPNAERARITPSVVAINKYGERLVGGVAWRQAITNPENTVFSIKRLMGRKYDEPEIDRYKRLVPYKVVRANNGDAWVELQGKAYSPPEISAMILQKLKTDAEAYLGERVMQAVITVPAHFNEVQRQATKDAGRIAGLDVLRIINEPTAASLAYGLDKKKDERVAVYSFGGGTFDISILELGDGVFEVKSTTGNPQLGGDDFDHRIMNWLADEFRKEHDIDLRQDRMAIQRLKEAAEKAKKELSSSMQAEINLPFITADASGPKHLTMTLTRSKLEQLVESLIEKSRDSVMKALADADARPADIQEAVLVGGQTRMPAIQELVRRIFDREPHRGVNPDEVVAVGAAVQAGVLTGDVKDVLLLDVTPFSLGIETLGGVFTRVIHRNTTIPTQQGQVFSTYSDNQPSFEVNILQGEREFAKDNRSLGSFILDGIPPAPRGVPQIEVTFDIDANGIINVSARDKGTGREQKITIVASSGLSKDQIDRMVREAENHAAEDKLHREEVEERSLADSAAYRAERSILDLAKIITPEQKSELKSKIADVRTTLSTDNVARIKLAREALEQSFHKISEAIYRQSAPGGGNADFAASTQPDESQESRDDTIEGEYKGIPGSLSATTAIHLKGSEKQANQNSLHDHKVEDEASQAKTPPQPVPRIFVSHSHIDNDFGSRLAQDLRKALGDESAVWYDVLGGLHGGDTWWERILDELAARDIFIVVLSPDAMSSLWVRREINMALNEGKLIIPLLYRNCAIRVDLKTIQIISFLPHKTYDNAFNELLTALGVPEDEEMRRPTSKLEDPESEVVRRMTPLIESAFSKRDWSDVLRKVDFLLKRAPNTMPAAIYRIQGLALFAKGERQRAQEALDIALALVNDDVLRLTLLRDYTTILTSLGQWDTVLNFANEALQLLPNDPYWLKIQEQATKR